MWVLIGAATFVLIVGAALFAGCLALLQSLSGPGPIRIAAPYVALMPEASCTPLDDVVPTTLTGPGAIGTPLMSIVEVQSVDVSTASDSNVSTAKTVSWVRGTDAAGPLWESKRHRMVIDGLIGASSTALAQTHTHWSVIDASGDWYQVIAYDPATGTERWWAQESDASGHPKQKRNEDADARLLAADRTTAILVARGGEWNSPRRSTGGACDTIFAVNPATGTIRWQQAVPHEVAAATLTDGTLYARVDGADLSGEYTRTVTVAFDLTTGATLR